MYFRLVISLKLIYTCTAISRNVVGKSILENPPKSIVSDFEVTVLPRNLKDRAREAMDVLFASVKGKQQK